MGNYAEVKAWRKKNPDKVAAQARRYKARHPETNKRAKARYREKNILEISERDKAAQARRRKADPEGARRRQLAWRERLEARLTIVAGRKRPTACELCHSDKYPIVFDHCHSSGMFRGWICDQCNKVLGLVYDSASVLRAMADYLERHRGDN